jgi:hypothetical protein
MQRAVTTMLFSGFLTICATGIVPGQPIEKKGTTAYVTHFVFYPLASIDVPSVGKAVSLEVLGPTEKLKSERMLDKTSAKCSAVGVDMGSKKYIDGACALTDGAGDIAFSTFDTRDLGTSQLKMNCGTYTIVGASSKYFGIAGRNG